MKKIATVTLHGAHNFGSMLQCYALQNFIKDICAQYKQDAQLSVINLRNPNQKALYSNKLNFNCPSNIVKSLFKLVYKRPLDIKFNKFEDFLSKYINLTSEVCDQQLNQDTVSADYYISGSDQVWNIRGKDFSWKFLLDFVPNGKKISYAASCGPLMIDWSKYDEDKYKALIADFDFVSVREEKSKEIISAYTNKDINVNIDPTLLLSKQQWQSIQSNANYNNGKYILLYCLEPTKQQLEVAKAVSKKLGLPILITRYNNKADMINPFVKRYDSGPCDFLSYIDNASLVITSSFHGTAFSIIYQKPFYSLNGLEDNRISSILLHSNLTNRVLNTVSDVESVNLNSVDFTMANQYLTQQQKNSADYLKQALDL